jgi:SAM-dependent methyltransferase
MDLDGLSVDVLRRCAEGELSPEVAAVHLLIACGDLERLRPALAAAERRPDTRAAIARVRSLLAADPGRSALVLGMLEAERAMATSDEAADEVERCRRLFDRLVGENPEASVALYSLGDCDLLDAATREVVMLLDQLALLGPERQVLEIGCGIGRFQQALADRVAGIIGIDVAPQMIAVAKRRCAGLPNVAFIETCGHDLAPFAAGSFDLVLAIDAMPYVHRAGMALVAAHFEETARVLRGGGDFVILNLSYRGDLEADRRDVHRLADAAGLSILRNGTMDLRLWDGTTFHLRKSADSAIEPSIKQRGRACGRSTAGRGRPRST